MWLRDSTAQVRPYLVIAKEDKDLAAMISGLVKKQFFYINIDPYANAFNEEANGAGHQSDHTEMNDWIWEENMRLTHYVILFNLPIFYIKIRGKQISLMIHLFQESKKF